jgi:hypothetical protein
MTCVGDRKANSCRARVESDPLAVRHQAGRREAACAECHLRAEKEHNRREGLTTLRPLVTDDALTTNEFARWWRETGEHELRQELLWSWDPLGVADPFPNTDSASRRPPGIAARVLRPSTRSA